MNSTHMNIHTPVKPTILVLEDDPDMQIFLSNLLQSHGYVAIQARNAVEGLQKAKVVNPAVIIIDAMLPKEEGVCMYQRVKMEKRLQLIPVILLASIDKPIFDRYQKQQWIRQGRMMPEPEAFLEKPPEAEALLQAIRSLCTSGDKPSQVRP